MTTEDPENVNQRRSLRVMESAYIQYEVISEQEFSEGLERRKLRLGRGQGLHSILLDLDARLDQKLFLLKTHSKHVGDCLAMINDKINAVIQHIPETLESNASLAQTTPYICQIGAEGMAFSTDTPQAAGTKLALRFLLEADSRYIETFSEVVRTVDPPIGASDDRPYGIAVKFHGMKPAQKEILIQHLFNQESETLRMRRLELDAMI
jgi:hypothetical protein